MDDDPDIELNGDEGDATPHDDCEPDNDDEYTLGWEKGSMPYDQTYIGMYGTDELEDVSEDQGAITGDDEYSLGTTEEINQVRRREVPEGYYVADGEPSLGWTESAGRGIIDGQNFDDREGDLAGSPSDLEDDKADCEESLGWREQCSQRGVGTEAWSAVDAA